MASVLEAIEKANHTDPAGTAVLMDLVVLDVMARDIAAHGPLLTDLVRKTFTDQLAAAKQTLGKTYVAKAAAGEYPEEGFLTVAQCFRELEDLVKADRKINRDEGGRFATVNTLSSVGTLRGIRRDRQAPAVRRALESGEDLESLNGDKDLKRHQDDWNQANSIMAGFASTFPGDTKDADVRWLFREGESGPTASFTAPLDHKLDNNDEIAQQLNADHRLVEAKLVPKPGASAENKRKITAYNAIGTTTGSFNAAALLTPTSLSRYAEGKPDDFDQRSGTDRLFNRMKRGGNVLEAAPGTRKYGRMMAFAGEYGGEADRVLGPSARKTAYRYRGTEKTPDAALRQQFGAGAAVDNAIDDMTNGNLEAAARAERHLVGNAGAQSSRPGQKPTAQSAIHASALYRLGQSKNTENPMTSDQLSMAVRADAAVAHMIRQLPEDPKAAELSIYAGQVLPSQGVLIDADGDIRAQAVGYGEDHYLPFNLNNLKDLRGGQYVRTRMQGGLTAEDVYTLIATGGRRATVVSSGGVFTLEMDPNFRGGRGMSDKAMLIHDRYLKILDAVANSGMYLQDLDADAMADLAPGGKDNPLRIPRTVDGKPNPKFEELKDRKRHQLMEQTITPDDREQIANDLRAQYTAEGMGSAQEVERAVEEGVADEVEQRVSAKVRQVSLNSEGYALALQTLQQQFPYFIREASWEPLRRANGKAGFFEARNLPAQQSARQRLGGRDKGYVAPRGVRTESTREGFYRTASDRRSKQQRDEPPAEPGGPGAPAGPGGPVSPAAPGAAQKAPASVDGALGAAAASEAGAWKDARDAEINKITTVFTALGMDSEVVGHDGLKAKTWEQAKAATDGGTQAAFFLFSDPEGTRFDETLAADPTGVLKTLRNKAAVSAAAARALSAKTHGLGDEDYYFQMTGVKGLKSTADLATYLADAANKAADYAEMSGKGPWNGEELKDAFQTNGPVLFPDIKQIGSEQAFVAALSQEGMERVSAMVPGLIEDEDGELNTFSETAKIVSDRMKLLKNAQNFIKETEGLDAGMSSAEEAIKRKLPSLKLDELSEAVGRDLTPENVISWIQDENGPETAATDLQRAWSLVTAAKYVNATVAGDVHPKARGALAAFDHDPMELQQQGLGLKPVAKARSRRPAVVQVRKTATPLAEVLRLPPLPRSWSPRSER